MYWITCRSSTATPSPVHLLKKIIGKTETQIIQGGITCSSEDDLPVQMVSPPVKPTWQRHLNEPRVLRHWALAWHAGIEALHSSISKIYHKKKMSENVILCFVVSIVRSSDYGWHSHTEVFLGKTIYSHDGCLPFTQRYWFVNGLCKWYWRKYPWW